MILLVSLAILFAISMAQNEKPGIISGVVRDANGKALPGATIECYLNSQRMATATSDAKGAYTIRELVPGKYKVVATLAGYERWEKKDVKVSPGKTQILNIKLKAAELEAIDEIAPALPDEYEIQESMVAPGSANMSTVGMAMSKTSVYGGSGYMPPDFNTEEYSAISPNIFHSPFTEPLSTFSIDVDTACYSNVRRFLEEGSLPPANAVRTEELLNYFDYDYPQPKGEHPFSVYTEMGVCPWNQKRNLVHIGLQGRKLEFESAPPSNLVFLIDVSGSMEDANKLPLVRQSLNLLVENMRPQDRIALVVYAGAAGMVLPSTSGEEKKKISAAIDNLEAGGSTAGGAGIMLAYKTATENYMKGGNNRIILCTDGDFNIGVSSTADMEKLITDNRDQGVYLTVLGFGMGNYKDNRLEVLADKGNGNYAYIDTIHEAKKVLVNEMGSTLYTIAKDVKIQVEFNPAHVKAYRLIGYENRMLRSEDFKDDTKDAGEMGAGHSVTAIYEIIPAGSKEVIPEVDSLKYQQTKVSEEAAKSPEIMTVKLRYKLPDKDTSIPLETPVYNKTLGMNDVSETFLFSAAVVGYAMMLQKSEYKGALTWDMVRQLAKENLGPDKDGYRKEFLTLIDKAASLMKESRPE
jgi:Ca-activated chloride channel family protein